MRRASDGRPKSVPPVASVKSPSPHAAGMDATVAVTGGSGHVGSAVVDELSAQGYRTVALDRERGAGADEFVRVDMLDPGDVYAGLAKFGADAVVHLGTIPHRWADPGFEVFRSNAVSAYLVLEAASHLGIDTVVLPSSINVVGTVMQEPRPEIHYLPVDEDHPVSPREPYGLGKQAMEVVADGYGRAAGAPHTISSLRFPAVNTTESMVESFVEGDAAEETGEGQRDDLFTYVQRGDAARAARAAVEAEFEGHERFWIVADDTNSTTPTAELADRHWPDVERRRPLSGHEALVTNEKAERLLDWSPAFSWRAV